MVLTLLAPGAIRTSWNFLFLKTRNFTSRRMWNGYYNLKWKIIQYYSSVFRGIPIQ